MTIVKIFNPKTKKYTVIDTKKCEIIGTEVNKKGVCVLCKTNKAVHCWECSMNLVKKVKEEEEIKKDKQMDIIFDALKRCTKKKVFRND